MASRLSQSNFIIVIFVDNFDGEISKEKCFSWKFKTLALVMWFFGPGTSQRETDVPLLDQSGDGSVEDKRIFRLSG